MKRGLLKAITAFFNLNRFLNGEKNTRTMQMEIVPWKITAMGLPPPFEIT